MNSSYNPITAKKELAPSTGLGVVHLFCKVNKNFDIQTVDTAIKEARENDVQIVTVALLGHKADIGFMAIAKNFWHLKSFQNALKASELELSCSYVSLTETSEYAPGLPDQIKNARLYPVLPPEGMRAFCFYPMSKRRKVGQNWYTLSFEKRKELMLAHGATGRKYAGKVVQLVTGSFGLDDYEWGVTLFAQCPDDLKAIIYEMRFDEASAEYAHFGPFYMGIVAEINELSDIR
ncbi:MAG: chlorite dismutase family protein [Actinobacteria bacterium]|nr:chlorite dismutase family protein [Actinomycetota bacterium]